MVRTVQGFVMVDAWASALNNAGVQASERTDNIVRTKVFWRGREAYPYVSGQAWRYWWRMALATHKGWELSPIHREAKIAYTAADPLTYPDDDIFGYMRAPKTTRGAGGKKSGQQTVTRASVLKNSPLVSVGPHRPTEDFGTFSRLEGDPVPYEHEFYSTVLKGIFSIDLDNAGVFKQVPTAGSQNLPDNFEVPAEFASRCKAEDGAFVLDRAIRLTRVRDTLGVLPHLSGGAMSARHLTRVAPSLVVLGVFATGSHLLSHLAAVDERGDATFNTEALVQVLNDYSNERLTKVYVGRETGFMEHIKDALNTLAEEHSDSVVVTTVKGAVDGLCQDLDDVF